MLRKLFALLIVIVGANAHGDLITYPFDAGHDVTGSITFNVDVADPNDFSELVYPQQIVAFDVTGPLATFDNPPLVETPLGIRNGVGSEITPDNGVGSLTATQDALTLNQGRLTLLEFVGSQLGIVPSGQALTWQTATGGIFHTVSWEDGHPQLKAWQDTESGPAQISSGPASVVATPEPHALLLTVIGFAVSIAMLRR